MPSEGSVSLSVVEDVLRQHSTKMSVVNLVSMKEQEGAIRRYEAAAWLRRIVGVVGARDLPEEPTEEEFQLGLKNGIVLCNALNKVQPGIVKKLVETLADSAAPSDGAGVSTFQCFGNVKNCLDVLGRFGLPTFEASDLERGGQTSRVVDSVLALKSYREKKQVGKNPCSKHGGLLRAYSTGNIATPVDQNISIKLSIEPTEMKTSANLDKLVRGILSDKEPEEIPLVVEYMLSKVMEEFERRIGSRNETVKPNLEDVTDETSSLCEASISTEIQSTYHESKVQKDSEDLTDETSSLNEASNSTEIQSTCCENKVETNLEDLTDGTSASLHPTEVHSTYCENMAEKILEDLTDGTLHEASYPTEIQSTYCENKVELNLEDLTDGTGALHEASNSTQIQSNYSQNKIEEAENPLSNSKYKEQSMRLKDEANSRCKELSMRLTDEETSRKNLQKKIVLVVDRHKRELQELKDALLSTRASVELIKTQYSVEFTNLGKHIQIVTSAASGYRKVLEENRKLYNQLQDLKGNIRVYCRVRPFLPGKISIMTTVGHIDDGSLTIISPSKNGKDAQKTFTFNKAFGPSASQEEVFSDMQPLIRSILDGYNVCIFAYGQTGAGKTFTMTGPKQLTEETYGVNYRALNDLFQISKQRKDTFCYEISVQMIEIYNEQVRDLLNDGPQKRLDIRNNSQNGVAVPDANLVPVTSTEEVIELMNLGQKNRAVCSTAMNDRSSRSHSCLTIHVQGRELASGVVLRGSMHLVDLAGSERVGKSEVKGDRLKEAAHINKSLAALGDVISALAQKNAHVPYRNSKLTQLLQDSLGGQAKTLMFIHISPEADALSETLSTLKFAERVSTIELGAAHANKEGGAEVKELKQQVASLRAALAKKESENLQSAMCCPDIYNTSSQMQTMDDSGSIEVESCSALTQDGADDLQDSLGGADSSSWPEESSEINNDDALRDWEGDSFYQRFNPDSRVLRNQLRSGANSVATDDSDDLDLATSESEQETLSQSNHPKSKVAVNGGSKIKQVQSGPVKSTETRIPSRINTPSQSKKITTPAQKATRSGKTLGTGSVDAKKRPTTGKAASAK